MKKIYERPSLVKKGRLSAVTAQVAPSTQPPPLT
ncbi:putative RiPP precursor [Mesorhizobium silamurunense]